jgi:DNA-binding MarR family transcriptional regulator
LTELGYEVLNTLKAQDSSAVLPSEISNLTGILRGTLTDVLTRLELSGLVTRRRSTEDRRQVFAELTALGRRRCEAAAVHRRAVILSLMQKLSAAESHTLDHLLGEISQGLAEAQQRALFPSHES